MLKPNNRSHEPVPANNHLTILIVEGHERIRGALCALLALNFPDISLVQAGNGESALPLVTRNFPNLVLMDARLPNMSGFETARQIKRQQPEAKVVILSTFEAPSYQKEALDSGVSAYILKSNISTDLISTVTRLLP